MCMVVLCVHVARHWARNLEFQIRWPNTQTEIVRPVKDDLTNKTLITETHKLLRKRATSGLTNLRQYRITRLLHFRTESRADVCGTVAPISYMGHRTRYINNTDAPRRGDIAVVFIIVAPVVL